MNRQSVVFEKTVIIIKSIYLTWAMTLHVYFMLNYDNINGV